MRGECNSLHRGSAGTEIRLRRYLAPQGRADPVSLREWGPGCTFFRGCEHIKTQRIPTLSKLVYRIAAVDERQGVVLIRMDFGPGSVFEAPGRPKGQSLSVFEAFKVYGGQIHAVEAFMNVKPADQPLGWE